MFQSLGQSIRELKAAIADLKEEHEEHRRENAEVREFMATLALQKKANSVLNEDTDELKLPWNSYAEVLNGVSTPAKMEAIRRILVSKMVAESDKKYMSAVLALFFGPKIFGLVHVGVLTG